MQKRANPARPGWPPCLLAVLAGLTLVGSASGGITVETELTCYGEAMAQVVTPNMRQGPKGTAAESSDRLPDVTDNAGAYTFGGTCRTASRFGFTGRWEGRVGPTFLTNILKTLE